MHPRTLPRNIEHTLMRAHTLTHIHIYNRTLAQTLAHEQRTRSLVHASGIFSAVADTCFQSFVLPRRYIYVAVLTKPCLERNVNRTHKPVPQEGCVVVRVNAYYALCHSRGMDLFAFFLFPCGKGGYIVPLVGSM